MRTKYEYGVLLSCDYPEDIRGGYFKITEAMKAASGWSDYGNGIQHAIMRRPLDGGEWRSPTGETPTEVIRRRWGR